MRQANSLIGLLAETSLHAGSGSSTGIIDLPIQREGHTGWPCIYGSSVKGALRDAYETQCGKEDVLAPLIFGPDTKTQNASDHAGALAVGDARLLLLPVRSLTSQFKWVTCPAALQRLKRDINRMGHPEACLTPLDINSLNEEDAIAHTITHPEIYLEEYRFTLQEKNLDNTIECLSDLMPIDNAKQKLQQQLVIIHDDMFTHLANHATPVNAHIRIENNSKIVKDGALWYEETLPPDTLLYTTISANDARKQDAIQDASIILGGIKDNLFKTRPYLQVGGNETVGMGWCAVKFYEGAEQ